MRIPDSIPDEGTNVPLRAAFGGFKNVPLLSFSHNSATPKLLLFDNAIETRVIFSRRRPLAEIDTVDLTKSLTGANHLVINWKNRLFNFTAAVEGDENLRAVVGFFRRKDIVLGEAARRFIEEM